MEIIKNPSAPYPCETALILGNFDGVHRAHQALAKKALLASERDGLVPAAFTFSGAPSKGLPLCSDEEKARLLESVGIRVLFTFDFDRLKDFSAERFVQEILLDLLSAKALFCGFNYRFAKGRAASADDLSRLCDGKCRLSILPPFCDEQGEVISSTRIRTLLQDGKQKEAEVLLGHTL